MASCGRLADWLRTGCRAQMAFCDPRALNVVSYTALTGPALSVLGLDEDAIQVY
jgi:hypothetical protein